MTQVISWGLVRRSIGFVKIAVVVLCDVFERVTPMVVRAVGLAFVKRHWIVWSHPKEVGLSDPKKGSKTSSGALTLIDGTRVVEPRQIL